MHTLSTPPDTRSRIRGGSVEEVEEEEEEEVVVEM
jgi:hypothetical protein